VKKPLRALFDAMFHGKRTFADFLREVSADDLVRKEVKKGSKQLVLVSPSERLRAHHNFLKLFLLDFLPVHEAVFSYKKGLNAHAAVQRHAAGRHFFVTDIESFFSSISRELVGKTILAAAERLPVADLEDYLEHMLDLMCVDGSLPVGFATSPVLSNAVLYTFDALFQERCASLGVTYTRYADDIILSAANPSEVLEGARVLEELLGSMFNNSLKLHRGKSKFLKAGGKIKLLGMVLLPNGTISVDSTVKDEIETMLHLYLRNRERFNALLEAGANKVEARLAGLLNYVNSVDTTYLDKLRRKYGAAVVDLFLHRSFG
jgi:RNA-directed DNA polymerase